MAPFYEPELEAAAAEGWDVNEQERMYAPEPRWRHYRVHMTIRGSMVKPSYDGKVDVWASGKEAAFKKAVKRARATAHWDSAPGDFRLDSVEVLA